MSWFCDVADCENSVGFSTVDARWCPDITATVRDPVSFTPIHYQLGVVRGIPKPISPVTGSGSSLPKDIQSLIGSAKPGVHRIVYDFSASIISPALGALMGLRSSVNATPRKIQMIHKKNRNDILEIIEN